ncbi:hypothetical protein D3C76_828420 [compost metagenome]
MVEFLGIGHHAKVHLAQFDGLAAFAAEAVPHRQGHAREALFGAPDDFRQQQVGRGGRNGNGHVALGVAAAGFQLVLHRVQFLHHLAGHLVKLAPGIGQGNAVVLAVEQLHFQFTFQQADLPAQRRLGNVGAA